MSYKERKLSYLRGKAVEEKVYQTVKEHLSDVDNFGNYTNIFLERPEQYAKNKWHNKKKVEIDNIFCVENDIFLCSCKYRKGRVKGGNRDTMALTKNEIYFNGRKSTGMFLDNLWKSKQYIKEHKIYKHHGYPEIHSVLIAACRLKDNNGNYIRFGSSRGTYVITLNFFSEFLNKIFIKG